MVLGPEGAAEVFWESLYDVTPDQIPALSGVIADELEELFEAYRRAADGDTERVLKETNTVTRLGR